MVTESRRRTSNLLISKVTIEDAGNYTCSPSNAQADSVMVHVIEGILYSNLIKAIYTSNIVASIIFGEFYNILINFIRS